MSRFTVGVIAFCVGFVFGVALNEKRRSEEPASEYVHTFGS